MAGGRGSAMVGSVILFLLVVQNLDMANAAVFTVGDSKGWTYNVVAWTNGKRFRAGDVLVFNYSPSIHNVVVVNKNGYNTCTTPRGSKVFRTGRDRITLVKGPNSFICSVPGHCQSAMKISLIAS